MIDYGQRGFGAHAACSGNGKVIRACAGFTQQQTSTLFAIQTVCLRKSPILCSLLAPVLLPDSLVS